VRPGYFNKQTIYFNTGTWGHNCLVIDKLHQRRESDSIGRITDAIDTGELVWWRSDASHCYQGAKSVARELVMVRPLQPQNNWGFVVVRDRAKTLSPATFDFLLQPGGRVALSGNQFQIEGENAQLVGHVLSPTKAEMNLEEGIGGNVNVEDPLSLRISAPGKSREAEFVVVLIPLKPGEEPPQVKVLPRGLQVGEARLSLSYDGRSQPRLATLVEF